MLVQEKNSNIDFFGIALDPTDDPLKMKFKLSLAQNCAFEKSKFKSPYSGIRSYLKVEKYVIASVAKQSNWL